MIGSRSNVLRLNENLEIPTDFLFEEVFQFIVQEVSIVGQDIRKREHRKDFDQDHDCVVHMHVFADTYAIHKHLQGIKDI